MLVQELGFEADCPFKLLNDNRGAIALTRDAQFHGHSKHINIRHYFLHELVECGNIMSVLRITLQIFLQSRW